jgi:hypothetical protein
MPAGLVKSKDAVYALEVGDTGSRGNMPRRSWSGRLQVECNETEQVGLWTTGSQRNTNAARCFNDAAGNFQEMQANAGELTPVQWMPRGDAIA